MTTLILYAKDINELKKLSYRRLNDNDKIEYIKKYLELQNCEYIGLNDISLPQKELVVKYICKCGNIAEKSFSNISKSALCKTCSKAACGNKKRFTIDDIRSKFNKVDCTLITSEYVNSHQKLDYVCNKCGENLSTSLNLLSKLKNPCRCYGSYVKANNDKRLNIDELTNILKEYEIELYSNKFEYKNNKDTMIPVKCQRCGKLEYRSLSTIHKNKRCVCNSCEKGNSSTFNDASIKILNKYDGIILLTYSGFNKDCEYICNCGNVNKINYSTLWNHGVFCPHCMKTRSKGEEYFKKLLIDNNIKFTYEKTFDNLIYKRMLKIDFFIDDKNIAIEIDGAHHYESILYGNKNKLNEIIERDNIKNMYCRNNNIILYRIKYNIVDDVFMSECNNVINTIINKE